MKNSFDARLIGFLSSLVSDWEKAPPAIAAPARTVRLPRAAVLRLEKNSHVQAIEVKTGAVWLTSTPAAGDVLLTTGERFETGASFPYIIQALEPGEIILSLRPAQ